MFDNFTDDQLRNEVKRREEVERKNKVPKIVNNPDFSELQSACQSYINAFTNKDDDGDFIDAPHKFEHYVFENAIEAFFGKNVFDWINEQY